MDAQTNGIGTLILVRIGCESGSKWCGDCPLTDWDDEPGERRCAPFGAVVSKDFWTPGLRCDACLAAETAGAVVCGPAMREKLDALRLLAEGVVADHAQDSDAGKVILSLDCGFRAAVLADSQRFAAEVPEGGMVIGVEIGRVLADWDAFGEGISLIPCRVVRSLCAALAADGITLPAQAQGPQAEDAGGGDAL